MLDVMIGIFIFVGVIAVTTLLFSGWAVYGVIRVLASGLDALFSSSSPASSRTPLPGHAAGQSHCPRSRCHASNPPGGFPPPMRLEADGERRRGAARDAHPAQAGLRDARSCPDSQAGPS